MTERTVPSDADTKRTKALVQDHVDIGDTIEVRNEERTGDRMIAVTGEVTGLESELAVDGRPNTREHRGSSQGDRR